MHANYDNIDMPLFIFNLVNLLDYLEFISDRHDFKTFSSPPPLTEKD